MDTAVIETIESLLPYTDPEGIIYGRLMKMLDQAERGVFIGPKSRRLLASLVERKDNVECRYLEYDGMCDKVKGECKHRKRYTKCEMYEIPPPPKKGNPLRHRGG